MSDDIRDKWDKSKVDQAFFLDAQVTEKIVQNAGSIRANNALGDIAQYVLKDVHPDELKGMEHFVSCAVHVFIHPQDLRGAIFLSQTSESERAKREPKLSEWMCDKGTQRMRSDIMKKFGRSAPKKRSGF